MLEITVLRRDRLALSGRVGPHYRISACGQSHITHVFRAWKFEREQSDERGERFWSKSSFMTVATRADAAPDRRRKRNRPGCPLRSSLESQRGLP